MTSEVKKTTSLQNDLVKGMFFGGFLGDALGAPHEFVTSKYKYTGKLEYPIEIRTRWQGTQVLPVGSVTDDSEMSLALLIALVKEKWIYKKDTVVLSYMDWANSGGKSIGKNTRQLFRGIKTINGYVSRAMKYFKEEKESSQSNGCLMRCSPLALLSVIDSVVETDVNITNSNDVCRQTTKIQVICLWMALRGYKREEIQKYVESFEPIKEVKEAFLQAKARKDRDVKGKTKGWILHAFYCSMLVLYHYNSFSQAMKDIINLGGDTDTNASIAGSLLGALLGYKELEKEESNNIKLLLQVNEERPEEYQPYYLSKLLNLQ